MLFSRGLSFLIGNVFVIAAILLERHLHSVANYLIVSLAVADLLVACLVMPLGAVYEVNIHIFFCRLFEKLLTRQRLQLVRYLLDFTSLNLFAS